MFGKEKCPCHRRGLATKRDRGVGVDDGTVGVLVHVLFAVAGQDPGQQGRVAALLGVASRFRNQGAGDVGPISVPVHRGDPQNELRGGGEGLTLDGLITSDQQGRLHDRAQVVEGLVAGTSATVLAIGGSESRS